MSGIPLTVSVASLHGVALLVICYTAASTALLLAAIPAAVVWLATGYRVGKRHDTDQSA